MADVQIKGLSELNKLLLELPAKLEANVIAGALRAGANVFKGAAQQNIRKVSGETAKSLKLSVKRDSKSGRVTAKLRSKGRDHIARFLEFGTKAHAISVNDDDKAVNERLTRKRGRLVKVSMTTVNRSLKLGGKFRDVVMHPGITPRPFMRPAFDGNTGAATVAFGNYIKKRLATKHGIDTADIEIGEAE